MWGFGCVCVSTYFFAYTNSICSPHSLMLLFNTDVAGYMKLMSVCRMICSLPAHLHGIQVTDNKQLFNNVNKLISKFLIHWCVFTQKVCMLISSVLFQLYIMFNIFVSSFQSLDWLGHRGDMTSRQFSRNSLPVFSARGHFEQCPSSISSADQCHPLSKDGFGEAVVACEMPEPC